MAKPKKRKRSRVTTKAGITWERRTARARKSGHTVGYWVPVSRRTKKAKPMKAKPMKAKPRKTRSKKQKPRGQLSLGL